MDIFLVVLCVILMAALSFALNRLYQLKSSPESRSISSISSPSQWEDLLSMLLRLHELGMSSTEHAGHLDFCQAILESACRLVGSSKAALMLYDEDSQQLKIFASKGFPQEVVEKTRLQSGQGVAGKAFQSGQKIFISDPSKNPEFVSVGDVPVPSDLEPFIALPLKIKNKPIGVLNLHATGELRSFSDQEIKFLSILADQAAITLENLHLYDSLQTFYLEMVLALARALDAKDSYSHDHADRARQNARKVAEELNLPSQMVRYIEYAALMHDVGKIGIDDSILLKPGKLTPEEYEVMKKHPAIGHQILAPVKFLGPVAQMVLYHQEWYNGKGYPEGLAGEEIPLGARVVAIIDAWDAMTSDRPYRKALTKEKAIDELRKGAGTQFDPKAVEAFLRIVERNESIQQHLH